MQCNLQEAHGLFLSNSILSYHFTKAPIWLMYNWTWLLPALKVMLRVISNHLFLLNNIIVFTKKPRKNILAAFIQFNLCLSSNVISWVHSCRLHCKISVDLFIFRCDFLLIRERGHFKRFFLFYTLSHDIIVVIFAQLLDYNYTITIIVYDMVW